MHKVLFRHGVNRSARLLPGIGDVAHQVLGHLLAHLLQRLVGGVHAEGEGALDERAEFA